MSFVSSIHQWRTAAVAGCRAFSAVSRGGTVATTRMNTPAAMQTKRWKVAHEGVPPATPMEALEYLRKGNERFVSGNLASPHRDHARLTATAGGQAPFAAFLGCADSRVPIEIAFDQGFGDVFVTRVAGNIVTTEITASLEFGCAVLGAKVLYVLGHTSCGAVKATMEGAPVPGVISSLYYGIHHACRGQTDVDTAVVANVKEQVRQLSVSPVLGGLVKDGKLMIVGGVYDLATGKVTEVCRPGFEQGHL